MKRKDFPFCFVTHLSRKVPFQRTFLPVLSLLLLVLSFSIYLFIFLCFSFFLLQPVIFQTISSPSFPLLQLIQCSTFSTFWFPSNPSLFLILNVCLHILILISLSRALSLSSEMTKIHFLFAITKSSLPMFPPLCLLFGPSTVFIFVPVEQHCPQPSQPSFLLVVPFSNLPIN